VTTTPSSDWLIPLSHWLIHVEVSIFTENIAARVFRFAVMTCKVKSTDVSPPIADAGLKGVAPTFIRVGGVSFPGALRAPSNPFSTFLVPAVVALLWKVAVLLYVVVAAAGVTEAKSAEISSLRGRIGRGGVGDMSMLLEDLMRVCSEMGGKGAAEG
jgi:hypothetical protein